jgi:flavin reductase
LKSLQATVTLVADVVPDLATAFRDAMRAMTNSVHIISARSAVGVAGMTATAVCSLSFDPISMLVCVNRSATLFAAIERERHFAVNLLGEADVETATIFGSSAGRDNRAGQGEWEMLCDVPVLATSASAIVCGVADFADFGTHRIYFGAVIAARTNLDVKVLLYGNGKFSVGD